MKVIKPNTLPTTLAGFARASTATYVDDAGVLQTAGVNVPRWERGRLLVEGAATNLLTYSQDFSNAAWIKTGASVSSVAVASPVASTFFKLVESATLNSHSIARAAITPAIGDRRVAYVIAKAGERRRIQLIGIVGNSFFAIFDLIDGAVVQQPDGVASGVVPLADGWQLCWLSKMLTTSVTGPHVLVSLVDAGTNNYYTGDGTSGVFLACAQFADGLDWSSYIPTTTTAATRAADVLTGGGLLYSSATDATAAYVAGTTYAAGALVQFDRSRYQSLQAANTGHTPDVSPTWWARLGPVNQWAMFDDQVSTQTVQASGPLRVALQAGAMDSLAVLGVDADRVRLVVQDGAGGPVVYDQEQGMAAEAVASWFDYFFNDPTFRRTQALFSGIPPFGASVASLTFSGSQVKVGHVSYGRVRSLGGLRYGARAGIKDFSRKDTDDFGVTTFVRRANSKYLTGTLEVEKVAINQAHNLLTSLTATPVVWIGSEDAYYSDTLLVFGFFRDFYCSIDYPTMAIYSLEIEGLI